ncbi:helix-turn-helix domain-containing protein [Nocardioides sp. Bht2]|uniref:helix-turn-helix domain-containing protein n=1 Tax=Nocardioides sp. Bht2 TaxID=3392297 RepID=UPI0039B4ABE0
MSKASLSRASGVSRSAIDSYLSGESSPTARQLKRLAEAGGCEVQAVVVKKVVARPIPESLVAVLEFGELFPPKRPKPLPDMREVWARARARARA